MTEHKFGAAPQPSSAGPWFLMDREALFTCRDHWIGEPRQALRDLSRLDNEEAALFDDLRNNCVGRHVRFEQEKIGFG